MGPALDIGTLYLATAVVAGFYGIALLGFHTIDSTTHGILHWGLAYLLVAVGLTLNLFRGTLPLLLYGPIASLGFIAAAVLLDAGMREPANAREPLLDLGLPIAALVLLLVFAYLVPSIAVRLEVLFLALAVLTTRTSVRLVRSARAAEDGLRPALVVFSAFYTVLALVLVALSLLALVVGPVHDIAGAHPIHALLLPGLMLFLIGAGMSKLWVHYLRAYDEAKRAATTDPLTGVRNRRYVMPELERMFGR
ncbi:MAG: hypothetical protein ACOC1U_08265, partial [Spirochaetota bacterium]